MTLQENENRRNCRTVELIFQLVSKNVVVFDKAPGENATLTNLFSKS